MLPQPSDNEPAQAAYRAAVGTLAEGRYASALALVGPFTASVLAPRMLALTASCYRQLGAHELAAIYDARGLVFESSDAVGRADCATGWAADAIGTDAGASDQLALIAHRLMRAEKFTELAQGHQQSWRLDVRLLWVRAESLLLADRAKQALVHADRAVTVSRLRGTPRHLAKSLLVQGVTELALHDDASAVASLESAAAIADFGGLQPLRLPTHGLLGQLLDNADAVAHYASAAAAADFIAGHLPDECSEWRSQADVLALTGSH